MKTCKKVIAASVIGLVASMAHAAPALTPKECHSFPFVKSAAPVTHRQLMTELAEYEQAGYNPVAVDATYPAPMQRAERVIQREYRQDCLPAANVAHADVSAKPNSAG